MRETARRAPGRSLALNLLTSAGSIVVTLVALELAYRGYEYAQLVNSARQPSLWTLDAPPYRFAPDVGFRYRPNADVRLQLVGAGGEVQLANRIRVNNHGHVSVTDDTIQKPGGQFRIAILGNSFAAGVNQNTPWPSSLERRLNADSELPARLGVSSVKVLNFGLEGTGIVQWDDVFLHDTRRYDPDLVLINFVSDDIRRRFAWRDMLPVHAGGHDVELLLICGSLPVDLQNRDCAFARTLILPRHVLHEPMVLARIKSDVYAAQVKRLNWRTLNPELLSRVLGERFGLSSQLRRGGTLPSFSDMRTAVDSSAASLRRIMAAHGCVLLLHNPEYFELVAHAPHAVTPFFAERSGLDVISMAEYFATDTTPEDLPLLFNLPYDGHFSDYGAERYAQAVHAMLRARIDRQGRMSCVRR